MAKSFLPREATARANFLNDLVRELELPREPETLVTLLKIDAARMGELKADAAAYDYTVNVLVPASRRFDKAVTTLQNSISVNKPGGPVAFPQFPALATPPVAVTPGIFRRLSLLVRHIKAQPAYTAEIGELLDIVASDESENGNTPKPIVLSARPLPGSQIRLKYIKGGYKLILIESRRGGETQWSLLDKVSSNIYLDTRPPLVGGQPEVREYRVRYLEKDQPIGDYSNIISATTTL